MKGKNKFDWTCICEWIKNLEACKESAIEMQENARKKIKAVIKVNK